MTARRLAVPIVLAAGLILGVIAALAIYFAPAPPSGQGYRLVDGWPRLPAGQRLGQVSGVGVGLQGQVFVFHRADRVWQGEDFGLDTIDAPVVLAFDGETGNLQALWGAGAFVIPHSLTVDPEGNLWLTDVGLHQALKFDPAGNLLLTLGEAGVAGAGERHFNQPTDVAVAPDGSIYVSDGYGNSRLVRFSAAGEYLGEWGGPGDGPGQFNTPHGSALDAQGRVYVADRGNARLQIFDSAGQFIATWQGRHLGRPWAVRAGSDGSLYVVDGGDQPVLFPDRARILKLDAEGNVLASFGSYGSEPGQFIWPHAIAVGPDGALYVGEVATGMRVQKFEPTPSN
jgi:peptidylamidoglycolate lyase